MDGTNQVLTADMPGNRRDKPAQKRAGSRRLRHGIRSIILAALLLGAYVLLEADLFRNPRGERLLLHFLIGEDAWKLVLFGVGGLSLFTSAICLVPPPVNRISIAFLRRALKVLLGILMTAGVLCWFAWAALLLLVASDRNYSTVFAPDGRRVLVAWQSYGAGIWTPYIGPFHERRRDLAITDLTAVVGGNCSLSTEDRDLRLNCGNDSILIPATTRGAS